MRTKRILLLVLIAYAMIQDQALVAAKRRTKHYLVETKEKSPGHKQKHGDYGDSPPHPRWPTPSGPPPSYIPPLGPIMEMEESQIKLAWTPIAVCMNCPRVKRKPDVSMKVVFPDGSTDLIDLSPSPLATEAAPCLYRGALKGDNDSLVTVNGCHDQVHPPITVTIFSKKVNGLVDLSLQGDKTYEIKLPSFPTWGKDDDLAVPKEKSPGHSTIATTVATSENDNSCSEVDDCYSKGHCFPSIGCKCLKNECQSGHGHGHGGPAAICKSDNDCQETIRLCTANKGKNYDYGYEGPCKCIKDQWRDPVDIQKLKGHGMCVFKENGCKPGYIIDEERGQCGLCSPGCCWHEPHNLTMVCFSDAIHVDPEEEATTIATTVATTERDYSCNKVDDCYSKKRCLFSDGCKCRRNRCERVKFCKSANDCQETNRLCTAKKGKNIDGHLTGPCKCIEDPSFNSQPDPEDSHGIFTLDLRGHGWCVLKENGCKPGNIIGESGWCRPKNPRWMFCSHEPHNPGNRTCPQDSIRPPLRALGPSPRQDP